MATTAETRRVCFLLQLRPERVADYLAAHDTVWPEMLEALRTAGWRNYSLFLRAEDGLVVGYLETDDFEAALQGMAATEVNARWQADMAQYFGSNPDQAMRPLAEYFHLD
ncbi:L-rhamnose mutarotase [Mycolicibacterium rutilum]|uniref:L-rhamnose mutarotase n=1 Tax=Mycolicibacterium rutilum TaxID=370526 RepID=A0A1H6M1R8_MYCRU|nr:L-rhamnose mutarotase [Mycolicibacterium rutilum]SEH91378.1 L-rhamnose mutarotase [Mycolicibacterium rutilum]